MPSIQQFFKLTTGMFSVAWDNPDVRRLVGVLAWPHQVVENSHYQVRIEAGGNHQGHYVKIDDAVVRVIPDKAVGYNFICPWCADAVRALYMPRLGGDLRCRVCYNVTYKSDKTLNLGHWHQKLRGFTGANNDE